MSPRHAAAALAAASLLATLAPTAHAWSPTPTRIVYDNHTGGDYEIQTMNPDGTAIRRLTDNTLADNDPAFSPGGGQIAWGQSPDGKTMDLWVMNADGSGKQRLTDPIASSLIRTPSWSPDGQTIYFYRTTGQDPSSGLANAGDIHSVTREATSATGWGPEEAVPGLSDAMAWESEPVVSPDGRRIAYGNDPDGAAGPLNSAVWVADLVNGAAVNSHRVTTGTVRELGPTWSPDGTQLAFYRTYLYTVNLATGRETQITRVSSSYPDWSTTSPNEIVFDAFRNGQLDTAKVTLGGKKGPVTTYITTSPDNDFNADW